MYFVFDTTNIIHTTILFQIANKLLPAHKILSRDIY